MAVPMDPIVPAQLEKVRSTGRTNMASKMGVQYVANELNLYALVIFAQDCIDERDNKAWADALDAMTAVDSSIDSS